MNPLRLSPHHPLRKAFGTLLVAGLAAGLGLGLRYRPAAAPEAGVVQAHGSPTAEPRADPLGHRADMLFYDLFYRLRTKQDMHGSSVAVVGMSDFDLEGFAAEYELGYPWPRQFWGNLVEYLAAGGVKAIVFDMQFMEPSQYNIAWDDDADLGRAIAQCPVPVILAAKVRTDGTLQRPILPMESPPRLGVVTVKKGAMLREYAPVFGEHDSLAVAALKAVGAPLPEWAKAPFLLRFYGPFVDERASTFLYVSAFAHVHAAIERARDGKRAPDDPKTRAELQRLKGRIVLIGTTGAATFDLYSSPLSSLYPGVDMHATAIENLLNDQRMPVMDEWAIALAAVSSALAAAAITIFPIGIWIRLGGGLTVLALLSGTAIARFVSEDPEWMPLAAPLTAGVLAVVGGFGRNYVTEDARRRLMTRALGQYVSPEITRALERKPDSLRLDAEQRPMTALFSDMAGFTDFSEAAEIAVLTRVLNVYMERMSAVVLAEGGTIDKYIGDAIMAFWNAPLPQEDHAARACRAALRMRAAERAIREELLADASLVAHLSAATDPRVGAWVRGMGETSLYTRFGINTGPMNVGNWGSARKFQYTVIGDAVNAAARLEPSNKRYGTRILIAQRTAEAVRGEFLTRRVDLLRVKGKAQAMTVHELVAEGAGDAGQRRLVEAYEAAFERYLARDWDRADQQTLAIRAEFGEDGPTDMLRRRIEQLRQTPPDEDWDGVFVATDK